MPPTEEQMRRWKKNYYNKHKDYVKQYNGTKVECEICGSIIQRSYKKVHQRNKKCIKVNPNIQANQTKPEAKADIEEPKPVKESEPEPEQIKAEPKQTSKPRTFELKLDNEDENSRVFTICIKC